MFNKKPKKMMVEMVRMELVWGRGVQWSELLAGLGLAKTGSLVKLNNTVCRETIQQGLKI